VLILNMVGVLLLFSFGMPYRARNEDSQQRTGSACIIFGTASQIMGNVRAGNSHAPDVILQTIDSCAMR
jgi:hypothetical protein